MTAVCFNSGHALAARACTDGKSALVRPHIRCTGPAAVQRSERWAAQYPPDHRLANRIFPVASTSAAAPQRRACRLHASAEDRGAEGSDILEQSGDWAAETAADAEPEDAEDEEEELIDFDEVRAEYMEYCQEQFSIPDLIDVVEGVNGLPCLLLRHPNGSEAEIYLHGANVVSWRKADGTDLLYLRPDNTFDGRLPIQGGVPVIFPQYGRGMLPTNGFLRDLHWSIAETARAPVWADDPAPTVALWAEHTAETAAVWPHRFEAMYTVSLMEPDDEEDYSIPNPVEAPDMTEEEARQESFRVDDADGGDDPEPEDHPIQLRCVLEILNTDDEPFTFVTALQSHFAVHDMDTHGMHVRTLGLGGRSVLDYAADSLQPQLDNESEDYLTFGDGVVDRLYVDAAGKGSDVMLCPGDRTYTQIYNREGFKDIGAYNPHHRMLESYRHFVSLHSACVARPITLQPGESWVGEMAIRAHDVYWPNPMWEEGFQPLPPAQPRSNKTLSYQ